MSRPVHNHSTTIEDPCVVCGNRKGNKRHLAREMLFGTRQPFEYGECSACGTWWLLEPPDDMSPHYPEDYRWFGSVRRKRAQRFKNLLSYPYLWLYLRCPSDRVAAWLRHLRNLPEAVAVLRRVGIGPGARILDVGAGSGKYLLKLYRIGFRNVSGIDKFIAKDLDYGNGVQVLRKEAADVSDTYDVVTTNHVFEHLPDPRSAMAELLSLVKPGGTLLIRTPNADSWACREYQSDWFSLDPPRHLVVYTPDAIRLLAKEFGLAVESVTFDAENAQIIFSDQYRRNIAFNEPGSFALDESVLPEDEIDMLTSKTARLNRDGDADAMCVLLRKPESTVS